MMEMTWNLPRDLLPVSVKIMRPYGQRGLEGLALWFGSCVGSATTVTHAVVVHGPGFKTSPQQLQLSMRAMAALTELSGKLGAHLVGQIHSHPGVYVDLSLADVTYGIRRQDYLSLVCPYYAQRELASIDECGVHVFDAGRYRRLDVPDIRRRLRQVESSVTVVSCEVPA